MGYDNGKLTLVQQSIAGRKEWLYEDTGGEAITVYQGAGYFADAKKYGVDTGDPITIVDAANKITWRGHFITLQDTGATQGTVRLDTGQP
jgi:hypothetical protein